MFALARTEDVVAEFDAACRAAAVRGFDHEAASPFTLFLNAAADTLGDAAEIVAPARHTIVIEITEGALVVAAGRAAARADPVPQPGLGRRARERRRRLALAGADVAAVSRRHQARPAPPPAALAGGHRADRRRRRRRERAPAGGRARRGHRLRGADGGRARVRRPARAGLPARRAGAAPLPHAGARPPAAPDLLGRRSGRRQPVPARDELEAPGPRLARAGASARPG